MVFGAALGTWVHKCQQTHGIHVRHHASPSRTILDAALSASIPASLHRKLDSSEFVSLACNQNLPNEHCGSWTSKFGTKEVHTERIIIECGECVNMDYNESPNITLLDGIDIRGKLVFRDSYGPSTSLTIISSMIVIQGQLDMHATSKPVDGVPQFTISMIGSRDEKFAPINENANVCDGDKECTVGHKGIIVAGGKINVHGIPLDCPTWVHLYDVVDTKNHEDNKAFIDTIIVDDKVLNKWAVGAEILITSNTETWDDHQVRKITDITKHDCKFVKLHLNEAIVRPTTLIENYDFAVEVALLSRNIVFNAISSKNSKDGGHFMVLNTINVDQTLEGVDVQNFGQQGNLGRYPIHFHCCGNASGSVISKNTIRHSNQRCVVIHGTNNINIEENIAYDTKGHCFILEDGIETGNRFIRNLGAQIGIPDKIIPDEGPNGVETDGNPSIFWITNPSNYFVGNVAAGSQGSGYWFELMVRGKQANLYPDLNPKKNDLTLFENNTAHSCSGRAVQTYPTGYVPENEAKLLGLKIYRNEGTGLFMHITRNIAVVKSLFANNRVGIDIDRAENITIRKTRIIGTVESSSQKHADFDDNVQQQRSCKTTSIGIELHTWKNDEAADGIKLANVTFSGFGKRICPDSRSIPMSIDDTARNGTGMFDLYTNFRKMTIPADDALPPIDFCTAVEAGIPDIYLTDVDGSLLTQGLRTQDINSMSSGVLIGRSSYILHFLDLKKCESNEDKCYEYCREVCIQSVRFEIDPAGTEQYQLQVCKIDKSQSKMGCQKLPGYLRTEWEGWSSKLRMFVAHLPVGKYESVFLNNNNEEVWPSFVTQLDDDKKCDAYNEVFTMDLVKPEKQSCSQLIRNGNFEASSVQPVNWLYRFGGLTLVNHAGIDQSNALSTGENFGHNMFAQYIDDRCLHQIGAQYKVSAAIKLVSRTKNSHIFCQVRHFEDCPTIGLRSDSGFIQRIATLTTTDVLLQSESNYLGDGYYELSGNFLIDETIASTDQIYLYIEANIRTGRMIVDDVRMELVVRGEHVT